jgi:hypothetical protein
VLGFFLAPPVSSKIVAVWIDVEDHEAIIDGRNASVDSGWLQNATEIAHSADLRLAADAQVGWAFAGNAADPTRPVHQQVMDIVDEITLMDYFSACSTSSKPVGPAGRVCDPTQAMYLAAPWISYASFLQTTRNRSVRTLEYTFAQPPPRFVTVGDRGLFFRRPASQRDRWFANIFLIALQFFGQVLLDIGVALGSDHGRIETELELEQFLQDLGRLKGEQGGAQVHNFAVFENHGYEAMALSDPCPRTNEVCGPATSRPSRAVWWYGLLHAPGSTPIHTANMVLNVSTQEAIIKWCEARHVTELYIDQWSSDDPIIQASFEDFVWRADNASIDLQL